MRGIVYDDGRLQVVDDLTVKDPGPGEVHVAVQRAGVCHSDASVVNGTIPFPTPVVLGHEGAGIVTALGPGVTGLAEGDHVVLSTLGACGMCAACDTGRPTHCRSQGQRIRRPFVWGERKAFQFANAGVFAETTVVNANQAVKIDDDVPFDVASLIGCGVVTGVGAVFNRAEVTHGQSTLVIGVGGIGLNVIQGCRLADALPIIAIDANPAKEGLARSFGATHFIDASSRSPEEVVDAVKEIVPNGVDFAFECVGHPALIRQAVDLLDWGGTAVILGVPKLGTEASFVVQGLYNDKSIMGCRYGSARPHHDFPMLVDLYKAGRLELDSLVTATYPLDQLDVVLEDMHAGKLARGVLEIAP